MLYRLVAILVVGFWLTMTALLLRNEVQPSGSSLREVPVEHVVKLILHHEQSSDLNIISDRMRLGRFRLQPHNVKEQGLRIIAFDGNLQFRVPGGPRQRVAWKGELEMNKDLETQRFRLGMTLFDPMEIRTEILILPLENVARYESRTPSGVEHQEFSLDEQGARELFLHFGFDPKMLGTAQLPRVAPPIIQARQSSMKIHGERIDTYLVTIESNGQTWLECHVSQLGQVLQAKTLLGYTLAPDDIIP